MWRGIHLFQTNPSEEVLLKVIQLTPWNPGPFYRLGLLHQRDIRSIDLEKSRHYLHQAIQRNPLEQNYWVNLAKVLQRMGEQKVFEQALENAILVYPTGYQGRWVTGTLFLEQGALEKALPHFSYLLLHYPDQSGPVYDVWLEVVNDTDFIWERLVPKEPAPLRQYLCYLYGAGDSESAKKVWQKRVSLGYKADRSETLQHIEFLISHGEPNEAFEVWKARLQEEGLPTPSDGNLITNGGFEKEQLLGGGFDWKIENVAGVGVSFDPSDAFEGKSSLKIRFNGKENVDFHHVYQFVAWKPNTEYLLRAHVKTKGVTTQNGLKIEVSGVGPALHGETESLTGDNEWKELNISFRTPPQSHAGLVRVRREKTDKFDRFISGTVWIDDVELMER
jgi:hypothetical protein